MQLEVCAFGKLTLSHQAHRVAHFPTRQTEELLGFLLVHPHQQHSREKLIALLWPQVIIDNGRHRFSIILSRLRASFKQIQLPFSDYIHTSRDWVLFDPERPFTFDRDQFIAGCQHGFQTKDTAIQENILLDTLALYRADLMEGIYANWCLAERERLSRLRLRALGRLMYCTMQRHAYAEAIEFGHIILQEDPLREEAHRALMLCYQQQGRLDLANQQFTQCANLLQTELDTLPLPETISLYSQIMGTSATHFLSQPQHNSCKKREVQAALATFLQAAIQLKTLL